MAANARVKRISARPARQDTANTTTQTLTAGTYADASTRAKFRFNDLLDKAPDDRPPYGDCFPSAVPGVGHTLPERRRFVKKYRPYGGIYDRHL
jgi:hypothetical protein